MDKFPECGKPIDLDIGAGLSLTNTGIPSHLAHLIPLVNKWSFVNLYDQDLFVELMKKSRNEEVEALNSAFNFEIRSHIREWAATLPFDKDVNDFTAEDRSHPYWSFLNVIKLLECTGGHNDSPGYDSPGYEAARARFRQEVRRTSYAKATCQADDAFREGRFGDYVEILGEYDDLLTETQRKKMQLAQKKSSASKSQ